MGSTLAHPPTSVGLLGVMDSFGGSSHPFHVMRSERLLSVSLKRGPADVAEPKNELLSIPLAGVS